LSETDWLLLLIAGAVLLVFVAVWARRMIRARRRAAAMSEPFPHHWRELLEARLPLYARMPMDLRLRLEPVVRAFLADVEFVGCAGLEVTDEMRLVIAAQACLLIVEHGPDAYSSLRSVLVYPDEFVVEEAEEDEAGVVIEGTRVLSGQTFETDRIVLSWRDVRESSPNGDAYNVVLHEFAHYLDHSVGGALTSVSSRHEALKDWHEILEREYQALCDAVERGEETLIDPYGAEDPAEFFAVATETFFELPHEMRELHPHLYDELRRFYGLDPVSW
jgi:Mlc titration factor MtfA (ptsG expression regulator)